MFEILIAKNLVIKLFLFVRWVQDYENFINSAEAGVVLFSLGCTGFSAKDFPAEVTSSFVSAFAKLKQKVIMRFDPTLIPDVPDNVIVSNWVPQQEILGIH